MVHLGRKAPGVASPNRMPLRTSVCPLTLRDVLNIAVPIVICGRRWQNALGAKVDVSRYRFKQADVPQARVLPQCLSYDVGYVTRARAGGIRWSEPASGATDPWSCVLFAELAERR